MKIGSIKAKRNDGVVTVKLTDMAKEPFDFIYDTICDKLGEDELSIDQHNDIIIFTKEDNESTEIQAGRQGSD